MNLEQIIQVLNDCIPHENRPIHLHEPCFTGKEWEYTKQCLDEGMVSSVGSKVDGFERLLEEYTGASHAIAVVNGTAALHIALQLIKVKQNEEILLPTMTFVATANAVAYCNAIPHFIDCESDTLGADANKLEVYLKNNAEVRSGACYNKNSGNRIRGLIAVHVFGHPVDLDSLMDVCSRFHIELIEDAAESLGSFYKDRHTGTFGKVSTLSFNGNKIITTGGGGAILTNDPELAHLAKHLTTTAKKNHPWEFFHDQLGYNYRLPNINAALGCAQMEQLPDFLSQKRNLSLRYQNLFKDVEGIKFFAESKFAKSNYWLNTLILDSKNAKNLIPLIELTHQHGIMTRPIWKPMHELPLYKDCPRMDLSVSEDLSRRILNIPSSATLGVRNERT
jgi:perosamine synthetase